MFNEKIFKLEISGWTNKPEPGGKCRPKIWPDPASQGSELHETRGFLIWRTRLSRSRAGPAHNPFLMWLVAGAFWKPKARHQRQNTGGLWPITGQIMVKYVRMRCKSENNMANNVPNVCVSSVGQNRTDKAQFVAETHLWRLSYNLVKS